MLNLADISGKLARWRSRLLEFDLEVVHRTVIKQKAPDTVSRVKSEGTDKRSLDKRLLVLMTGKTEEQKDVRTKYFYQDQPDDEQAGNHRDSNGKEKKGTLR